MPELESWSEYRMWLIKTLERLELSIQDLGSKVDGVRKDGDGDVSKLRSELADLRAEFREQKVRTGFLGAAAGSIPPIVMAIIWYLTNS